MTAQAPVRRTKEADPSSPWGESIRLEIERLKAAAHQIADERDRLAAENAELRGRLSAMRTKERCPHCNECQADRTPWTFYLTDDGLATLQEAIGQCHGDERDADALVAFCRDSKQRIALLERDIEQCWYLHEIAGDLGRVIGQQTTILAGQVILPEGTVAVKCDGPEMRVEGDCSGRVVVADVRIVGLVVDVEGP